jgi:hypothetical protein
MSPGAVLLVGLSAAVVLLAAACGSSAEEKAAKDKAACEATIGEFVRTLQDLDARLNVGVAYAEYGTEVGDISAAYARIDRAKILDQMDCLAVATAGESALNSYSQAGAIWTRCIQSSTAPGCHSREQMLTRLRTKWSDAGVQVQRLTAALSTFGQANASTNTICPPGQTVNEKGYCG